jgi:hypothetical protein
VDVARTDVAADPERPEQLRLLSDRPVDAKGRGQGSSQQDLLDRAGEAERLARLLFDSRSAAPFTLAVYADWGMGKTSLLNQTAELLDAHKDVAVVRFNAWMADGDGLEMLIKSVLDQLDPRTLHRLARKVSGNSAAASWGKVLIRGAAGTVRLHHLVDGIWIQLAVDARTRSNAQELLREALSDYTKGPKSPPAGRTVAVFVDDLDRCPPETIQVVCAAIKQYLNVPGLVFVIGCDRAVIDAAITVGVGHQYLDKIIQAYYPVPAPTDEQIAKLILGYASEAGVADLFREAVVQAVAANAGRNPRRIKQLINRFVVEYRLDPEWETLGADALIRTALLQDLYPEFHELLVRPSESDPFEEFQGYQTVVRALREAGNGAEAELVYAADSYLSRRGIALTIEVGGPAALTELEAEVPAIFVPLKQDKVFIELVTHLTAGESGAELRRKLRRGSRLLEAKAPVPELEEPPGPLDGLIVNLVYSGDTFPSTVVMERLLGRYGAIIRRLDEDLIAPGFQPNADGVVVDASSLGALRTAGIAADLRGSGYVGVICVMSSHVDKDLIRRHQVVYADPDAVFSVVVDQLKDRPRRTFAPNLVLWLPVSGAAVPPELAAVGLRTLTAGSLNEAVRILRQHDRVLVVMGTSEYLPLSGAVTRQLDGLRGIDYAEPILVLAKRNDVTAGLIRRDRNAILVSGPRQLARELRALRLGS